MARINSFKSFTCNTPQSHHQTSSRAVACPCASVSALLTSLVTRCLTTIDLTAVTWPSAASLSGNGCSRWCCAVSTCAPHEPYNCRAAPSNTSSARPSALCNAALPTRCTFCKFLSSISEPSRTACREKFGYGSAGGWSIYLYRPLAGCILQHLTPPPAAAGQSAGHQGQHSTWSG